MKKAAIITLTGNFNYGNKLQNYAIQELVKKNGYDVYTLWNKPHKFSLTRLLKEFAKLCLEFIKDNKTSKRRRIFYKFNKKFIKTYRRTIYTGNDLSVLDKKFDKFVIGSDQIWNCKFNNRHFGNFEFANFADKKKCISYAASFGISEIPEEKKEIYQKGFEHLSAISVREQAGAKIIKDLSSIDAKVVLDPTMVLEKSDWEKIIKQPKEKENQKYILTYFLGGLNKENTEKLEQYAKKNDLKIIESYNRNTNKNKEDNKYYYYDPSEFLYLIKNAELVLTDSFHACVFSIIFERPFFVLDREDIGSSMSSRLDTLLGRYDLNERKLKKIDCLIDMKNIEIEKYDKIIKKIEADRKESFKFIQKALKD